MKGFQNKKKITMTYVYLLKLNNLLRAVLKILFDKHCSDGLKTVQEDSMVLQQIIVINKHYGLYGRGII